MLPGACVYLRNVMRAHLLHTRTSSPIKILQKGGWGFRVGRALRGRPSHGREVGTELFSLVFKLVRSWILARVDKNEVMPLDPSGPTLVMWRWRLEPSVRQPQVWTEFSTLSSSLLLIPGYSAQHPRVWKPSLDYISRARLLRVLRCFIMFLDSSQLLEGFSCIGKRNPLLFHPF